MQRPGRLAAAMRDSLRAYWQDRTGYQTMLCAAGLVMLASGVLHTVVYFVSGSSWYGPVSWRKPMLFGYSFAVTDFALAWVMTFLPKRSRLCWRLLGSYVVTSTAEVLLITLQRWRGVPSHFNFGGPVNISISAAMSALASVFATVIVVIAIWTFRALTAPTEMAWAIRAGMAMLVVGQALGGAIIAVGVSQVAAAPQTHGTVYGPEGVIFGAAGIMKVPHAVALHALQVLIILAWLVSFTAWDERRRRRVTAMAIAGYSLLLVTNAAQTFSGRAPLALTLPALLALVTGVCLLLCAFAAVFYGLTRSSGPAAAPAPTSAAAPSSTAAS